MNTAISEHEDKAIDDAIDKAFKCFKCGERKPRLRTMNVFEPTFICNDCFDSDAMRWIRAVRRHKESS